MFGFSVFMNADLTTQTSMPSKKWRFKVFLGFLHPCIYQKMMPPVHRQRLTTLGEIAKRIGCH